MHKNLLAVVLAATFIGSGCNRELVIDTGERPAGVGGTIAGTVRSNSGEPLTARKVTATDVDSGARFEQSTASNGGYTIQVPRGRYRLDVELRAGELLATRPDPTEINVGDLDGQRDFVIAVR